MKSKNTRQVIEQIINALPWEMRVKAAEQYRQYKADQWTPELVPKHFKILQEENRKHEKEKR